MPRIRTVKPDFFRDELLQDLEVENPGMYIMLVFAGLWGHCDSKGRFEWRPRQLKLDILPFIPFDMEKTLAILEQAKRIKRYEVNGKTYGVVLNFEEHQRITGKEATEGEKYPSELKNTQGNTGETMGKYQMFTNVQEKEEEEEEENPPTPQSGGKGGGTTFLKNRNAEKIIDEWIDLSIRSGKQIQDTEAYKFTIAKQCIETPDKIELLAKELYSLRSKVALKEKKQRQIDEVENMYSRCNQDDDIERIQKAIQDLDDVAKKEIYEMASKKMINYALLPPIVRQKMLSAEVIYIMRERLAVAV